jgi:DNA-binding NtrC family response regulator
MKKILIVDDEEFIREMLFEFVSDLGDYEVITAENGISSFKILDKENIAVIILDYTLPDIRGDAFIEKMKNKGLKIPVILTSGLSSNLEIEDDYKDFVFSSLKKPFDLEILAETLKNIFK